MKKDQKTIDYWVDIAKKQLLGRTIVEVRYLEDEEMESLDWHERCVVMILDDGNILFPSRDDEGNGAGALFTNNEANPTLPVI